MVLVVVCACFGDGLGLYLGVELEEFLGVQVENVHISCYLSCVLVVDNTRATGACCLM
jgi:hypothetical protein